MKAQPGDWLVVHARTDNQHVRSAEIVAVPSGDGTPPFTVRWLDTGHTAVVFPGPDATVVSAADKIEGTTSTRPGWSGCNRRSLRRRTLADS